MTAIRPLAVVLLFSVAGPASAQAPARPEPVAVPFTLLPSRHMLVEVSVNGKGPFNLIFDTGAPINLVSGGLAKAAGLPAGGGFNLLSGPKSVEVKTLAFGPVTAEKVPVMVMDHPTVKAISDAFEKQVGPIQGIIGFPFFARYSTTVDYQKKQLLLAPSGYQPGDYLGDLVGRVTALSQQGSEPRVVAAAGLWGVELSDSRKGSPGVTVTKVTPAGPAATGGLRVGDRVLTIGGRWTDTVADAHAAAGFVNPGQSAEVSVERGGKKLTLHVTPARGL